MKKLIYAVLLVVGSFMVARATIPMGEVLASQVQGAVQSATSTSRFSSPTLDKVVALEKPTAFQQEKIYALFNTLCEKAKKSGIKEQGALIAFINSNIPESVDDGGDTTLFKHAFPTSANTPAVGHFDCDSRSILVLSVLEALGKGKDIAIVDLTGHVLLTDLSQHTYYDLTLENIKITPDEYSLLYSNILFTDNDLESLVLTNIATEEIIEAKGDVFSRKRPQAKQLEHAREYLRKALSLNPRNIVAINNLKSSIGAENLYDSYEAVSYNQRAQQKAMLSMQILSVMVENYMTNSQAHKIDSFLGQEISSYKGPKQPQSASSFIRAVEGSVAISNYTLNTVFSDLFYSGLYQEAVALGQELVKVKDLDTIPHIEEIYARIAIAAAIVGEYDMCVSFARKVEGTTLTVAKDLYNVMMAIAVIRGKYTAEEVVASNQRGDRAYGLYLYIVEGHRSQDWDYSIDVLEAWEGFPAFKRQVQELAKSN